MTRRQQLILLHAALAILAGAAYGVVSVTDTKDLHETVAEFVDDLLEPLFGFGFGVSCGWFLPILLGAFLFFALLRRLFAPAVIDDGETRCRKCRYILRGITEPRCPECGERI
jgi:hypothetical protein